VATGGGAVLRPENRLEPAARVAPWSISTCRWHTLHERTRHDSKRPLLQVSDPRRSCANCYAQRDPLYREVANLIISGSRITVQSVLQSAAQGRG
jgi:shikimate kinase